MCEFRFLDRMISIKACYNTNITDTSCIVIEEHSVMSDICFLSTYPLLISNLHSDYIKKKHKHFIDSLSYFIVVQCTC